jgi:hypothetical protein
MVAYSFAHVGQLVNVDTPRVRRLFLAGYPQDLVIARLLCLQGAFLVADTIASQSAKSIACGPKTPFDR